MIFLALIQTLVKSKRKFGAHLVTAILNNGQHKSNAQPGKADRQGFLPLQE
jgi:hypothetical protein